MRDFFLNLNNSYTIKLFSLPHILMILSTFIIFLWIIYKRDYFASINNKNKKLIRYIFGVILVINIALRRGSFVYYGVYNWQYNLDINFCSFTSLMFIIYAFTGSKKLLNICYHMAFIGPLTAIILPSYDLIPFGYSFYSFILLHNILFIFSFIFIFMEDITWNKESVYPVIKFLVFYFATVFLFDYIFGVTYNFPLDYVNSSIVEIKYIGFLAKINSIVFSIYFVIIYLLLILGNKFFEIITKKAN